MSVPGTDEQKSVAAQLHRLPHLERIVRSTHNATSSCRSLTRMAGYAPGSTPIQPQRRMSAPEAVHPERFQKVAEYLASINLSGSTQWTYPLKTLPRPTGAATRVIVTEYDLPRDDAMPHDVVMDPDGMVWYSDFGEQFLGRLDPKTGKVTEYPGARSKPDSPKGMLDLEFDKDSDIWLGLMLQGGVAKFDRATEQFQTCRAEGVNRRHAAGDGGAHPRRRRRQGVDERCRAHGVRRVDLARASSSPSSRSASLAQGRPHDVYGIFADSANNLYVVGFRRQQRRADGPHRRQDAARSPSIRCRRPMRGRAAAGWMRRTGCSFAEYRGDKVAMFDTKTETIQGMDDAAPAPGPMT